MVEITKVAHVLAYGFLLSLGLLCTVTQAEFLATGVDDKAGLSKSTDGQGEPKSIRQQGVRIIQGDVLSVDGESYFIKELGGKDVTLRTDASTNKAERIQVGDRIEAKVDDQNLALSLLLAP